MHLIEMAFLSQLSDLHLVVLVIESLSIPIPCHDAQGLDLLRKPFDLDGLKDHNKV